MPDDGPWHITKIELEHNYLVDLGNCQFMKNYRHIPLADQREFITMVATSDGLGKAFHVMAMKKNGFHLLTYGLKDVNNFI